jgi:hypothetical protein
MIINIQAFNATGKDQRRIYDVLDDFQSRKPIDVIKANRPIVLIDEPQKIAADKSSRRSPSSTLSWCSATPPPTRLSTPGAPTRRAGCLQPEARQEDRSSRHYR